VTPGEYLALADWRRRVAVMWQEWRSASAGDPETATRAFRAAKDELFRDDPQSPLRPEDRASFLGLDYWPYDPAWRMEVRLTDVPAAPALDAFAMPGALGLGAISLPNSGQEAIAFSRIGSVELVGPLSGKRLSVYWIEGYGGGLFLPFRDATSGSATYGAGRYLLDSIKSADHGGDWRTGTLLLDFNMAYHPSCAYDPRWACPLAPPENRLAVPVEVGERLPWRSG
jgi:uncharacterized protein (DUF1684 family)